MAGTRLPGTGLKLLELGGVIMNRVAKTASPIPALRLSRSALAAAWAILSFCLAHPATAASFDIEFEELAPGVWAGIRPDGPRFPVLGTSTFVVSDDGVVVFDGGGMPIMAEQVIDKIRSLTDAPVTHVVTSHWHGDHNFGVYRFGEEYPGVEYIAHTFTDAALRGSTVDYIDGYPTYYERNEPRFEEAFESGIDLDGTPLGDGSRAFYQQILDDRELIEPEYKRAKVTPATRTIDDSLVIESGGRRIELLYLGHGNTEGDLVMWLPDEKIVATGDLVVRPTPYAFNMPPRAWAATLKNLNALGYDTLVPGHGDVQRDTNYVDLLIETATGIADQRDAMLADGVAPGEIEAALDFSAYRKRLTGGDEYVETFYDSWFEGPLRRAAVKELSGEPMVVIGPRAE